MKRLFVFLIAALCCLPLICCGKVPGASANGTDIPVEQGDPSGDKYDQDTDHNNDTSGFSSSLISTEDAYYFPGERGGYLYYYDKATGESGVLCGKPECTHDDREANNSCNGYIEAYSGQTVNFYRGMIYYYQNKESFPLFRMNTDGTGREKLFDLGAGCEPRYIPQSSAIHRGKLYGANLTAIVEYGEPKSTWNITCWDLETGEFKLIYEENEFARPTMFFFKNYVYICAATLRKEYNEESDTWDFLNTTLKIFRYDAETAQIDKLLDVTNTDLTGAQYAVRVESENRIYLAPTNGEPRIYLVSNGELQEIMRLKGHCTGLFDDRIFTFGRCDGYGDEKCCMHFMIADYDGNILFDGDVPLDNVLALDESKKSADIGFSGAYSADGAFFVDYTLIEAGGQYDYGGKASADCLVKYELVDGKLTRKLIAVTNWG